MPADVIEVDFAARREAGTFSECVDDLDERIGNLQLAFARYACVERHWEFERQRVGALTRALHRERARNFPFTDEEVLEALRAEYIGEPVAATAVAKRLDGREPTHSACVRAGLALSRLASSGQARIALEPTSHRPTRWAPEVSEEGRDDA